MMQRETIVDYEYLFKDKTGRYVLVQTGDDESMDVSTCVIYDKETGCGLIIEDDELAESVKVRLHSEGAPILSNIPG